MGDEGNTWRMEDSMRLMVSTTSGLQKKQVTLDAVRRTWRDLPVQTTTTHHPPKDVCEGSLN